jgi:hypothetical protein
MVPVTTDEAEKVVSTRAVPIVVMTVVPTVDVGIAVPSEVTVVLTTVTAVITAVVWTGIVVTVSVNTVVSYVDIGRVSVSGSVLDGSTAVAFPNGTVLLSGCNVAEVIVGTFVGKGCTGGFPPVSRVVITD